MSWLQMAARHGRRLGTNDEYASLLKNGWTDEALERLKLRAIQSKSTMCGLAIARGLVASTDEEPAPDPDDEPKKPLEKKKAKKKSKVKAKPEAPDGDDDGDDDDDDHDDDDDVEREEAMAYNLKHNSLFRAAYDAELARQAQRAKGGAQKFSLDALDEGAQRFVRQEALRSGKSEAETISALNETARNSASRIAAKSAAVEPVSRPVPRSSIPTTKFSLESLDEGARKMIRAEAQRQGISETEALERISATAAARGAR
jgi:hypothetical protein